MLSFKPTVRDDEIVVMTNDLTGIVVGLGQCFGLDSVEVRQVEENVVAADHQDLSLD